MENNELLEGKMVDSELLRKKIDGKGLKLSYVAKSIGLKSRAGLMKKINNETDFTTREIHALCELIGITEWEEIERIFFACCVA